MVPACAVAATALSNPIAQRDFNQAALSVLKHVFNLLASNAGKPFKKTGHTGPIFKVFKKSLYGNPRAFESPGTAYSPGVAFYGVALRPVKHGIRIRPPYR